MTFVPVIHLRTPVIADADALFPLVHQSPVTDTLIWDGPESREQYRQGLASRIPEIQAGNLHYFTIVEDRTGDPIGTCSIRPVEGAQQADIGLWIGIPYHGNGYGTRVVKQLLQYGFERLGLEKVTATVFVGNWASRRIFEKNQFDLEGILPEAVLKRGIPTDMWCFGISRRTFTGLDSS